MNNAAEAKILSIALLICLEVGKSPRAENATVPWRTLDALADAFREAGVTDIPDTLGKEAEVHAEEG